MERLRLLFENDDVLLTTDAQLHKEPEPRPPSLPASKIVPTPVPETALTDPTVTARQEGNSRNDQSNPSETFGPEPPPVVTTDSEEESDDYLSACKRTAQRKAKEAVHNASLEPSKKAGKKSHGRHAHGRASIPTLDITGDLSNVHLSRCFCPIVAVSKLPYKYLRGEASEAIAKQFFTEGKFWTRYWNL
jgi:hypothetical protein